MTAAIFAAGWLIGFGMFAALDALARKRADQ